MAKAKAEKPVFTDDHIKEEILRYLYGRWRNPKSIHGAKAKVSEIQKAMKVLGISREETNRNLSYLVDNGWVREEMKESHITAGKLTVLTEQRTFRIAPPGIEFFEGKSKFQKIDGAAGINLDNVSGVVVIGNRNVVRNESVNLFKSLDELDGKIRMSDQLTDEQKLDYQAEIKTIQSQLPKSNPDKDIVKKAWGSLEKLSTIAGIADLLIKIGPIIQKLLGI
jgi:hypothetical protein